MIRLEVSGECDCGRAITATVHLKRGGQAPVPCACGYSLMVSAAAKKRTTVRVNIATGEAQVLQIGDDEPEGTKH